MRARPRAVASPRYKYRAHAADEPPPPRRRSGGGARAAPCYRTSAAAAAVARRARTCVAPAAAAAAAGEGRREAGGGRASCANAKFKVNDTCSDDIHLTWHVVLQRKYLTKISLAGFCGTTIINRAICTPEPHAYCRRRGGG